MVMDRSAEGPDDKLILARFGLRRRKVSVITLADRARDSRQWQRAARLYQTALNRNPRNPPIWVQYGHVLKEAGRQADAEHAYRSAVECDPTDADAHLHLGHILKLRHKQDEAKEAYRRSFVLKPLLATAFELQRMGVDLAMEQERLPPEARNPEILFEISDLFS